MIASTLSAVASAFDDSHLAEDAPLYYELAPQGTQGDFFTYSVIADGPEYTFSEGFENIILQFTAFSDDDSPAKVISMTEDLRAVFDQRTDLADIVSIRRQPGGRPVRDPDGGWLYPTRYLIQVQST